MIQGVGRRDAILKAAIKVFSKKGIDKAKVSDIVKEANIAQGTFYLYFESKFSVIPAIAEQMMNHTFKTIKDRLEKTKNFAEQLAQIISATFDVTYKYKDVLALCYSGMAISGNLNKWESIYKPYYEWMTKWLEEAKGKKFIREDVDTEITAKMIIGLIEESAEQIYLFDYNYKYKFEHQQELIKFINHALGD